MKVLREPLVVAGGAMCALLVAAAVLAPALAPFDPRAISGASLQGPSARHLLGTNDVGQDVLSQVLWGSRRSLSVAVGAGLLATVLGVVVGMGAALLGGMVDAVAMRVVDIFLALPLLPLLVLIGALAGPRTPALVLVIGLVSWPGIARLVRSRALSYRARGFVAAARGFGGGLPYVVRRHLAPPLAPVIAAGLVTATGRAVLMESGLAFLGLGDPTGVSWGLMLNRALLHPGLFLSPAWTWWVLPAGFAVTLTVMGFTLLAVGLEPLFNPRWRRVG